MCEPGLPRVLRVVTLVHFQALQRCEQLQGELANARAEPKLDPSMPQAMEDLQKQLQQLRNVNDEQGNMVSPMSVQL